MSKVNRGQDDVHVVTNSLVQIAAIVTFLVGLLSILKDIGKLTMGAWHQVTRLYYWNPDTTLYRHIEEFLNRDFMTLTVWRQHFPGSHLKSCNPRIG